MSNPLSPINLSPAALGALQARLALTAPPPATEQETPVKPLAACADTAVRRGQYLDILV